MSESTPKFLRELRKCLKYDLSTNDKLKEWQKENLRKAIREVEEQLKKEKPSQIEMTA